jgi:undecaprenyl-diphosphatase
MWEYIKNLDASIFLIINNGHKNKVLDAIMPIISDFRYFILPGVLIWSYFFLKKGKKAKGLAIAFVLLIIITDQLSSSLIKPLVNRPRPYYTLDGVHYYRHGWKWAQKAISKEEESRSFPSTHAVNVFGGATFLSIVFPKILPILFLMAMIVGYSRIYLGIHYPLDVISGGFLGIFSAIIVIKLFNLTWENFINRSDQ